MQAEILDQDNTLLLAPGAFSEYQYAIRAMLCSGWSAARVAEHLQETKGVQVPVAQIEAYLSTIPEKEKLENSVLQERYKALDVKIDALGEMARLLRLSSDRLGASLSIEVMTKERIGYTDVAIANYWRMLGEYIEVKQGMGLLPTATKVPSLNPGEASGSSDLPTLRAMFNVQVNTGVQPSESHVRRSDSYKGSSPEELLDSAARGSRVSRTDS